MSKPVITRVVADADLGKWAAVGWIYMAPAFTRGHVVVCWVKDTAPEEPGA